MKAPTVLFDIDGTLLHMGGVGGRAMGRAMEEVWGLTDPLAGISFAGATDTGVARRVAPDRDPREIWQRYVVILDELVAERTDLQPLPGVEALLEALAGRGARVGLLTGNIRAGAEIKLRGAGLAERFDFALSGFAEDGEERTAIAAAARRRCGDAPLTVVGDTAADVHCARHVGARVLCVGTGFAAPGELRAAAPDRLVDDLTATGEIARWLLA